MLLAIEAWPLSEAIRRSVWAYPALETIHIAAFATVFGALMLLELRVFGAAPALPLPRLAQFSVPVALSAFAVAATAGRLMLISSATEIATNRAFQIKLGLIALGLANIVAFEVWVTPKVQLLGPLKPLPDAARPIAIASLVIWFCVAACGRLIAYF